MHCKLEIIQCTIELIKRTIILLIIAIYWLMQNDDLQGQTKGFKLAEAN